MVDGNVPIPGWFVRGGTVLVPKQGCKKEGRSVPTDHKSEHELQALHHCLNHCPPTTPGGEQQKGLRKGRRGCLNALMVDSMVIKKAAVRGKNLSIAWIDYQKVHDCVPHDWLEHLHHGCRSAPGQVRCCLSALITLWKIQFSIRSGRDTVLTSKNDQFNCESIAAWSIQGGTGEQ